AEPNLQAVESHPFQDLLLADRVVVFVNNRTKLSLGRFFAEVLLLARYYPVFFVRVEMEEVSSFCVFDALVFVFKFKNSHDF
ncbi:MAG: hypothetical protein Q4E99_06490, partial [Bacillota bacterium]|nr:hypothetical protein [Bacillota bacterium]